MPLVRIDTDEGDLVFLSRKQFFSMTIFSAKTAYEYNLINNYLHSREDPVTWAYLYP